MYEDLFKEYPELDRLFKIMRVERRDEILNNLKNNDESYANLIKNRTSQSMVLRKLLTDDISEFEKYMDFIYEQEACELEAIYEYAFKDALLVLKTLKILP